MLVTCLAAACWARPSGSVGWEGCSLVVLWLLLRLLLLLLQVCGEVLLPLTSFAHLTPRPT